MVRRTLIEERMLVHALPGYADYMRRIPVPDRSGCVVSGGYQSATISTRPLFNSPSLSRATPSAVSQRCPGSVGIPQQFRAAFQRFMAGFSEQCEGVVAIDGKVLRRSFDSASGKSPLHMVSAWGCEAHIR